MLKVVELFAGVGGFRLGLEGLNSTKDYEVVWANQWEPSTKVQHAFDCYTQKFGEKEIHVNDDISKVWEDIPHHDLLVGGFPCQDYSVARTLSGEAGIQGKKGVLFWEIMKIVESKTPRYVLLENVDRLLKSPSKQRGRDFSIMLTSFRDAGYSVEWRVINAAEYGFAQRRRRVFIFAYRNDTVFAREQRSLSPEGILQSEGFFAPQFPVHVGPHIKHKDIYSELFSDILDVSNLFKETYRNSGTMIDGRIFSRELTPLIFEPKPLRAILEEVFEKYGPADEKYYLDNQKRRKSGRTELEEMKYLKDAKKVKRVSKLTEHEYYYSEGSMAFPDHLDKPGRTMLTSEATCNRSSHVIEDLYSGRIRYLTPEECELLNGFPDGWTNTGMPERTRYFCMGNALVVGLIKKMGKRIREIEENDKKVIKESPLQLQLF
ncbi:DNA (cytosine-5-)-methyltransferase [Bacillus luteolus]|uniref:Cytosine-specific methyltransferase n=1 Tax=Litchfieldia luteola TaxID=682179 RepID=A0ABR9QD97_9BACI|nr:DNA (cytosine-5-)-methyltransferase [Cytobacillus luteolus]MBE4906467.1 DNA (cytosine-5-)-methyltransferase [Cytobacillus luteolus]MBP1941150.1 DNA (cytosine-5)-methyltransferase 1 [Cytobacillus luteolus]